MGKTELDILRDVSERLGGAGIAYMLTGSVAMNYYAQPRMTRDIDLVIDLSIAQAEVFIRLFEVDYYLDRDVIALAVARRSLFNMIQLESVIKVDCILLKGDPFRLEEFHRRKQIHLVDFDTWIVSREDLLLSKLVWAKDSGSEIQLKDARNLFVPECDLTYMRNRAGQLSVSELLEALVIRDG